VSDAYEKLRHPVRFEPGGHLAQLYPAAAPALVTSIHHQAIGQVGRGLAVEARAEPDGVVEAIRAGGAGFVLGVQWHPEFHAPGDGAVLDCAPILDEFLRAAGSPPWI
jgi:putative glutamine amidotransferase